MGSCRLTSCPPSLPERGLRALWDGRTDANIPTSAHDLSPGMNMTLNGAYRSHIDTIWGATMTRKRATIWSRACFGSDKELRGGRDLFSESKSAGRHKLPSKVINNIGH